MLQPKNQTQRDPVVLPVLFEVNEETARHMVLEIVKDLFPKIDYAMLWKFHGYPDLFFADMQRQIYAAMEEDLYFIRHPRKKDAMKVYVAQYIERELLHDLVRTNKQLARVLRVTFQTAEDLGKHMSQWMEQQGLQAATADELLQIAALYKTSGKISKEIQKYVTEQGLAYSLFRYESGEYLADARALLEKTLGDVVQVKDAFHEEYPAYAELFPGQIHGIEQGTMDILRITHLTKQRLDALLEQGGVDGDAEQQVQREFERVQHMDVYWKTPSAELASYFPDAKSVLVRYLEEKQHQQGDVAVLDAENNEQEVPVVFEQVDEPNPVVMGDVKSTDVDAMATSETPEDLPARIAELVEASPFLQKFLMERCKSRKDAATTLHKHLKAQGVHGITRADIERQLPGDFWSTFHIYG